MNRFIILILFIALIYLAYSYRHDIIRGGISYLGPYGDKNEWVWMTDLYHLELMAVNGKKLKDIFSKLDEDQLLKYVDYSDSVKIQDSQAVSVFYIPRHWFLNTGAGSETIDLARMSDNVRSIHFVYFYTETKSFSETFEDDKFYVIIGHKYNNNFTQRHMCRFKTWELLQPAERKELWKKFKYDYDNDKLHNNVKKYNPGLFVNSGRDNDNIANEYKIGMDIYKIPNWWKDAVITPKPKEILATIKGYNKFMNYAENLKINIDVAKNIPPTNFYSDKFAIGIVRRFLIVPMDKLHKHGSYLADSYIGTKEDMGKDLRSRIRESKRDFLEMFVKAVIYLSGQPLINKEIFRYTKKYDVYIYNRKQRFTGIGAEENEENLLTWLLRNASLPHFMIQDNSFANYQLYDTPTSVSISEDPKDQWEYWTSKSLRAGIYLYKMLDQYIPMEVRTNHSPTDTILYRRIETDINILQQYYKFLEPYDKQLKNELEFAAKEFDKDGLPILSIQLFSRFKVMHFKIDKEFKPLIKHEDIK